MPEGVPPDALLTGSIPPLVMQRQALPVRNGKVGLAPCSSSRPTVRSIHETAAGRTNVALSDWRGVEMWSRHRADEEKVRHHDSCALVSQFGKRLTLGFAKEVEQDGGQVRNREAVRLPSIPS
jgi:hypothetical protein